MNRGAGALVAALALAWPGVAQAIRPTDGDGYFGNGYDVGVPVHSLASAGGHFRVWWVEESADAIEPGDADADGVPDFAQRVAQHADEVWVDTVDVRGFRPPLDDSVYHDTEDFGGDARYDIYLQNLSGSDGYRVTEVCTETPFHCAGYFVMENDFTGFNYPSDDLAIRVLTSHEFFHAVQDAYDADQDRKWSEGTATWNEEQVFPEQGDFEAFLRQFLDKPERPFDRAGGAIADLYPYGAAIWAAYLSERFGPDTVREIWTACEDDGSNPDFLEAADAVLRAGHGVSVTDAFVEFTVWNLFTGVRADPARAYADGAAWPPVRLEAEVSGFPLTQTLRSEGLSARYLPIRLPDRGGAATRLTVSVESRPVRATALVWDGSRLGDAVALAGSDANVQSAELEWTGTPTLYLVVTGTVPGALPHDVTVSLTEPTPEDDDDAGGCGCRAGRGAAGARGAAGLLLVLGLGALARRRRARVSA